MSQFLSRALSAAALAFAFMGNAFAASVMQMPSNEKVHYLEIEFQNNCKISIVAGDGYQIRITSDKGHNLTFIAKEKGGAKGLSFYKINPSIFKRNGLDVEGVKASAPFDIGGALSEEMRAAGVVSVKHVKSATRTEWEAIKKTRASSEQAAMHAKAEGSDVPLNQRPEMRKTGDDDYLWCCTFTGCNDTHWRVCSTAWWSPPCGGDGCGSCCG